MINRMIDCRLEVEGLKRSRVEVEERLREELRSSLRKQQEQWQGILTSSRQEAEIQRGLVNQR